MHIIKIEIYLFYDTFIFLSKMFELEDTFFKIDWESKISKTSHIDQFFNFQEQEEIDREKHEIRLKSIANIFNSYKFKVFELPKFNILEHNSFFPGVYKFCPQVYL